MKSNDEIADEEVEVAAADIQTTFGKVEKVKKTIISTFTEIDVITSLTPIYHLFK